MASEYMRPSSQRFIITVVFLVVLFALLGAPRVHLGQKPEANVINFPNGGKIDNAEEVGPGGDALVATVKGSFRIEYVKEFEYFLITIYGHDFDASRKDAEGAFLRIVSAGSREDACRQNVRIVPFPAAYPERTNDAYPLSFC